MNRINAIVLTSFLMLTSCADEGLPNVCDDSSFIGEWRWEKTAGFTGQMLTPKNTGEERRLEISDLTWKEYLNDTLVLDRQYSFTPDSTSLFYNGLIEFEDSTRIFVTLKNCSLRVESIFFDTPIAYYVRTE